MQLNNTTKRSVAMINVTSFKGYKDGSKYANKLSKCGTEIY